MIKVVRVKTLLTAVFAALLLLGIAACSSAGKDASTSSSAGFDFNSEHRLATEEAATDGMFTEDMVTEVDMTGNGFTSAENSVIKTGYLQVHVKDPEQALSESDTIVSALGGSIENRYVYRDDEGNLATSELQLKVPADKFEEAFTELSELGEVLQDQRSDVDVTLEKADLQARIKALETSITRLTELMEQAENTSDLIEAETALTDRQQELDGLNAQLETLEDQVSYSRISLTLTTTEGTTAFPTNFFDAIVIGFKSLLNFVGGTFLAIGIAVPWFIALAIIILLIWGIVYGVRKARK